jgi:uncharacterized protein (DUF58 family)
MDSGFRQRAAGLKQRWQQVLASRQARWLARRVPASDSLTLSQRTIFILPTAQGALFGLGAIIVLVIAIAERNPVSLLLSSVMLSLFLLSLVLCYRNLSGLHLNTGQDGEADEALPIQRCFVGETTTFSVCLKAAARRRAHQDLWLGFSPDTLQLVTVPKGGQCTVNLGTAATRRGLLTAPRLMLRTRYPMGLWQAWSRPDLAMRCLVYPQPQLCALPANAQRLPDVSQGQQVAARQAGVDDFLGLRSYQAGDSRRRIAWQSLARGQGLKTKQFVREAESQILLSFDQFPGQTPEAVLSCLCFQVLQLSRRRQAVGLKLPGQAVIKPGQGEAHKHSLLQALALYKDIGGEYATSDAAR